MRIRVFLWLMTIIVLLAALPVLAQEDKTDVFTTTYDPTTSAHYRVAHFAAGAEALDVYINGEPSAVKSLDYPNVTGWVTVPAGSQVLAIVPAGADEDTALLEPVTVNMEPMRFYTIIVMDSAENGTLQAQVLQPDTTALTPGTTRVTFLQAIESGDNVGFYRDEVPFTTGFNFGDGYTEVVDTGIHTFQVVTGGDSPTVLAEQADVELRENRTYLIASIGQAGASGETAPQIVVIDTNFSDYLMASGALPQPGTVIQAVQAQNLTGDLSDALVTANLVDVLQDEGPYTLFAPAELNLNALTSQDPATLESILSAHVVEGEYLSQDLVQSVNLVSLAGTPITVNVANNGFTVNGVPILTVNIPASNGVIHLIGGLLDVPAANG